MTLTCKLCSTFNNIREHFESWDDLVAHLFGWHRVKVDAIEQFKPAQRRRAALARACEDIETADLERGIVADTFKSHARLKTALEALRRAVRYAVPGTAVLDAEDALNAARERQTRLDVPRRRA